MLSRYREVGIAPACKALGVCRSTYYRRRRLEAKGLFDSLYTDRGSHYWHTPKAGGKVDKDKPTRFGRAMGELGDPR